MNFITVMFRGNQVSSPSSVKNSSTAAVDLSAISPSESQSSLLDRFSFATETTSPSATQPSDITTDVNTFVDADVIPVPDLLSSSYGPSKSNNYDVIFASGNFTKRRLGNLALTRICNEFQESYKSALKKRQKRDDYSSPVIYKAKILHDIIKTFKEEYPSSRIWTKKNDGSDDWLDITDDEQKILSKLQWKLSRKKPLPLNEEEENAGTGDHSSKRKTCSPKDSDEICARKKKSSSQDSNESVAVLSLSRVIADLQCEIDKRNKKIQLLEAEIACWKATKNTYNADDSSPVYFSDESSNKEVPDEDNEILNTAKDSEKNDSNGHVDRSQTITSSSEDTNEHDPFLLNVVPTTIQASVAEKSKLCVYKRPKLSSPVRKIYSLINTKKTGADSAFGGQNITPMAGEITTCSMDRIIKQMQSLMKLDRCSRVLDIGSGQGKPNLHFAATVNPSLNVGVEVIPWRWYQAVLNLTKVCDASFVGKIFYPHCVFKLGNIREAGSFDPFTHIYMFSTGFNPKTYRAIARRLSRTRSTRYLVCYAKHGDLLDHNFKNLELIHQEEVTMVSAGEKKTAYFYKINQDFNQDSMDDNEVHCDAFFSNSYQVSKLDFGDHYLWLMKTRMEYERKFKNVITRDSVHDSRDCFVYPSDAETI